mmetsp:Transcript_10463/g.26378  ORF Transcript_10463/g.26378 Transcript_10463/m.26378 type:complete len:208 (-) Transcript_10463:336-959(-)
MSILLRRNACTKFCHFEVRSVCTTKSCRTLRSCTLWETTIQEPVCLFIFTHSCSLKTGSRIYGPSGTSATIYGTLTPSSAVLLALSTPSAKRRSRTAIPTGTLTPCTFDAETFSTSKQGSQRKRSTPILPKSLPKMRPSLSRPTSATRRFSNRFASTTTYTFWTISFTSCRKASTRTIMECSTSASLVEVGSFLAPTFRPLPVTSTG